ncbi:hypothetical protein [Cryptosporangium aurantiacum]|uniref:Uncharacterized protein n=1 Tax=Cryptosporangium aurantiacum TaxID=134849 RepID=A0A1M7K1T8_9ACTN|nr:hypothetical protein [Cryptosporangium aurantiacum]SHM59185.1 hypothetical protein SAMN05443668_101975 [Cryptosporangium aurantiacum]
MPLPRIAVDNAAIVVKGAFNPAIFSPLWLQNVGLIGETEFEAAVLDGISRDFAIFSVDWLNLQVLPDSIQLRTEVAEETERMRDVAIGILRALPHTPLSALGINRIAHFDAENEERWHAIGDRLAPKKVWSSALKFPATRSVSIIGGRAGNYGGSVTVTVEPSTVIPYGVFVAINDHYDFTRVDDPPMSRADVTLPQNVEPRTGMASIAIEILNDRWSPSRAESDRIIQLVGESG